MFEYSKNKYTFVRIFGILASRACAIARTSQMKSDACREFLTRNKESDLAPAPVTALIAKADSSSQFPLSPTPPSAVGSSQGSMLRNNLDGKSPSKQKSDNS